MKVKKWLLALAAFAVMAVVCAVGAGAETFGDFDYGVLDDGTVEITKYNGSAQAVEIPAVIDSKSVTRIGAYAFGWCESLINVKIPNGVTEIGVGAFTGCTVLTNVSIPDSVIIIHDWVFEKCTSLISITIPDSVTSIGDAFLDCTGLVKIDVMDSNADYFSADGVLFNKDGTELILYPSSKTDRTYSIPANVISIRNDAFKNCINLENVLIPDSVTDIGVYSFSFCLNMVKFEVADGNVNYTSVDGILFDKDQTRLIYYPAKKTGESYNIPDSTKSIGKNAFYGCSNLTSITVPYGVTNIDWAFCGCTSLINVTLPDNITSIGKSAFSRCSNLTSIVIPNSVTKIEYNAFYGCSNLNNITIPDGVTNIGHNAFDRCSKFTEITIPDSVTAIGYEAFAGCPNLYNITIPKSVTKIGALAFGYDYEDENYSGYSNIDGFKLYCYTGTAGEKYAKDNGFEYELLDHTTHTVNDWTITKAATCTTSGTKTGVCSVCGKVETATIAKAAHKYVNTVVKPTYTAQGYTLHKCSVCGASKKDTYTAKLTLAKVSGLKVKTKDSTSITLQWNKNNSASGYIIEAYNGKTWSQVAKITSNNTLTYKVTKLSASKTYQYRIKAYKTEGKATAYSANSATLSVNTNPSGMSGYKVKSKTSTSVTLQWNKNTSATGYELQKWDGKKWVALTKLTSNATTTYTIKSLKASTTYKYRIRAYKTIGKATQYSGYTELSVNTNPSGMSGYKVKSKTSTSVTLQWNKNTTATGYELQKWDGKKWVALTKITKNSTTTYTVKSLKASTTYKYRIRAYKTIGKATQYSGYSTTLSVNTNPSNMSGFKAKTKTATSITLQWNKNTSATGYELQKWDGKKWVSLTKITKNSTTAYTIKSLKASTTYKYRIRAYKTIGKATQYSSYTELSVNTNPTNMSGFKAKTKTATSITLQWNKNASATGYELQKWNGKKWVALTKITKNSTTTYTVKNLKANTTYKYRIRAYKTIGKTTQYSAYSATLSVNTIPSDVSRFRLNSKTGKMLNLGWDMSDDAAGYIVQQYKGGKWVQVAKLAKSKDRVRVNNLSPSTTYKFRIRKYANIEKTTVYGNWSYKSFKTEGKDCVDEVKFTPRGEKIDTFVAAHMGEVWNESYFDKPKEVWTKSGILQARKYPIPLYGVIQLQYWFAEALVIIGETNNGYYITSDNYYVYSEYVVESKEPPELGTAIDPIPQY